MIELLAPILIAQALTAEVEMNTVAYAGWPNCIRLDDGQVELIATTDVGPRIIRFGRIGGPNLFHEFPEEVGKTGGDSWRNYGGHRLWIAPEDPVKTYAPDNAPIRHEWDGTTLKLLQPTDSAGIEKQIEITLYPRAAHVFVRHRLTNRNPRAVELAPWCLSVMAPGGRCILPQEPYKSHQEALLPARAMALWSYTNMADRRWTWGTKYIQLRQDPASSTPQKLGICNSPGWAAYQLGQDLFIKRFPHEAGARYSDFGVNNEVFTNPDMLEVETLGPLVELAPGASIEQIERWYLFQAETGTDEDSIDKTLTPLLERTIPCP